MVHFLDKHAEELEANGADQAKKEQGGQVDRRHGNSKSISGSNKKQAAEAEGPRCGCAHESKFVHLVLSQSL